MPPLMLPALLVVSPLSSIPLFSSACGLIIALISVQMVLHQHKLWLPPGARPTRVEHDAAQIGSETHPPRRALARPAQPPPNRLSGAPTLYPIVANGVYALRARDAVSGTVMRVH